MRPVGENRTLHLPEIVLDFAEKNYARHAAATILRETS
jgi:hypothetical protein